jgi:hypothetical protein
MTPLSKEEEGEASPTSLVEKSDRCGYSKKSAFLEM